MSMHQWSASLTPTRFARNIASCLVLALTLSQLASSGIGPLRPAQVAAQNPQNFTIESFEADYYLERTPDRVSTMKVVERIVAVFPDFDQNHGIERAIPKSYQDHTVSLIIESVTGPQGKWNFTSSSSNDNEVLRIGDADKFVRGRQEYVIAYTLRNVINFQETGDELFWDVNGDQWSQPFGRVEARVHIPSEINSAVQTMDSVTGGTTSKRTCYVGTPGSTTTCDMNLMPDNGREGRTDVSYVFKAENLAPGETLTYAIGFSKDTFVMGPEIARARQRQLLLIAAAAASVILPVLITAIVMINKWRRYGRDPSGRGVIVPQYVPPKELNALESDYLLHESSRGLAATALLIQLAVRGYVHLYEIKKKILLMSSTDYELELVRPPGDLSHEELLVLQMFFGSELSVGDKVKVSELKNKRSSELQKLNEHLGGSLAKKGYFVVDPNAARKRYLLRGFILVAVGFLMMTTGVLLTLGVGLLLSGGLVLLFSKAMPARSRAGVEMRDYLLGVKDYMQLAEKDRINFLQSPAGAEKIRQTGLNPEDGREKVKLFEKLLPFAMLFGMEEAWGKQFKDVYQQQPDWYHGSSPTFNTVHFASSLHGFSSANAATYTSPSSSGGSGFSGGSSGGGGGGGGGGGW